MLKPRMKKIGYEPSHERETQAHYNLRYRKTEDKAFGLAPDRHSIAWPAIREIVSRKASPYTLAEIERESARRGMKLQQTTIEKGSSRKYALYHDTVLDKMDFVPPRYARVDFREFKLPSEGLMTASGSLKPVRIVGCISGAGSRGLGVVELFEKPIDMTPDTIGPTGGRQSQR